MPSSPRITKTSIENWIECSGGPGGDGWGGGGGDLDVSREGVRELSRWVPGSGAGRGKRERPVVRGSWAPSVPRRQRAAKQQHALSSELWRQTSARCFHFISADIKHPSSLQWRCSRRSVPVWWWWPTSVEWTQSNSELQQYQVASGPTVQHLPWLSTENITVNTNYFKTESLYLLQNILLINSP